MIRGYYGDIVISPYICFGIETDSKPENEYFFHIRNTTYVYVIFSNEKSHNSIDSYDNFMVQYRKVDQITWKKWIALVWFSWIGWKIYKTYEEKASPTQNVNYLRRSWRDGVVTGKGN